MVSECGKGFWPGAEVIIFVSEVALLADEPRQHASAEPALADARVEHCSFVARIRADDEDCVRPVNANDRRIEEVGPSAEFRMELRTVLATINVGRAELSEQHLQRKHFLDRRQIA